MLQDRIVSTLRFFDLQDIPLTLLELRKLLLAETASIKPMLNSSWDLISADLTEVGTETVPIDEILNCLETVCREDIEIFDGFYCLKGRKNIVDLRRGNYINGIAREKLIHRFMSFCRHLPFVRGIALGGSQALGQEKPGSDIDLFIITDQNFFWLARTFITAYFQILGKRRHGEKIANRFCLNHYVKRGIVLSKSRNLFQATDIVKFRPLVGEWAVAEFQQQNAFWVKVFFPNFFSENFLARRFSRVQQFLEQLLNNDFGRKIEGWLGRWQMRRIRRGEFVVAEPNEISFHSLPRKQALLADFFENSRG
jgi:hypothetical protein